MNRNVFWGEAVKGGTIIGLVVSAFELLKTYALANEISTLKTVMAIASLVILVALIFGYTRRFANNFHSEQGFTYGNGMSFVLGMMIFTGIIVGVCTTLMYNFMFHDYILGVVDEALVQLQDVVEDDVFDQTYQATKKMMYNPIAQVFSNILSYLISGGFIGLVVCGFTKREPDWTIPSEKEETQE